MPSERDKAKPSGSGHHYQPSRVFLAVLAILLLWLLLVILAPSFAKQIR